MKSVHEGEVGEVEVKDRGLFDFMGKEEGEKCQEEVLVTGVEKLHVEETEKVEEKKESLLDKLHRSHRTRSSSSSDEQEAEGEGENKEKKKKKGLKEKIKEKLIGEKKDSEEGKVTIIAEQDVVVAAEPEDTTVVVEKVEETVKVEAAPEEEKKGFLEKIKEKLPGHHKKPAEEATAPPTGECVAQGKEQGGGERHDVKEKKGIFGKIMEKLPGYHKRGPEEGEKTTPPTGH